MPEAAFRSYTDGKKKLLEHRIATEMEEEMKKRLEAEVAQITAMTEEQHEIDTARRHIESMLNLKCPRCKSVFVGTEVSGCMALTCGTAGGGAGFCGWCQEDCGADAHDHAARCPEVAAAGERASLFSDGE